VTRDNIIRVAREFGWSQKDIDGLLCIVETVAEAEREACAKIVENYCGAWDDQGYALANAIRARGEK
jgi:hypothetical protein